MGVREPGLSTLNESRRTRHRQMTTGKAAIGGIPPKLFLSGLALIILGGFAYYRVEAGKLEGLRSQVQKEQRALELGLGPKLRPVRDLIEAKVAELAKPGAEFVEPKTDFAKLFASPGLYLRVPLESAAPATALRAAGKESLRDGFTGCLMQDPRAPLPGVGPACKASDECASGEYCTEFQVCQRPSSPFNMRLVYRSMSILDESFVNEVKEASSDLELIAHQRMMESITRVDVPLSIEVYQRARYAVVVLDEAPAPESDKKVPDETKAEWIARHPHEARVGVWSIPGGELLARLSLRAEGTLRDVGRGAPANAESVRVRARQANSCGLAMAVRSRLQPEPGAAETAQP